VAGRQEKLEAKSGFNA